MSSRLASFASVSLIGFSLTGCVAQEKYNALKLDRDQMAERLGQSEGEARAARAENDLLKKQFDDIASANGSKDGLANNLVTSNASLQARLDELNKKYADALSRVGVNGSPLPEALNNELQAFASQNPDLVDFDPSRGMVKFKSDVTFAVGDAELTPKAKEVISRFSTILNSAAASQYELLVAGHTDNQPVRNPQTISKGHRDNWYLSSHRAIAVSTALQGDKVSPSRIGVLGYGEYRPAVPNASAGGQAQNRRVEVLILPTTARASTVASTPAQPSTPAVKPQLNKDSAQTETAPLLNK